MLLQVLYFTIAFQGLGQNWTRFQFCDWTRFRTVFLSRIRPVDTYVPNTLVLLRFYILFFYTIDLEFFPPFTIVLLFFGDRIGHCADRFFTSFLEKV